MFIVSGRGCCSVSRGRGQRERDRVRVNRRVVVMGEVTGGTGRGYGGCIEVK